MGVTSLQGCVVMTTPTSSLLHLNWEGSWRTRSGGYSSWVSCNDYYREVSYYWVVELVAEVGFHKHSVQLRDYRGGRAGHGNHGEPFPVDFQVLK
ncbi:hypothetical protein GOBAR_AA26424 [Gossypium barbadense]|uniref:Uncharacterized protein n=1 Tax=Gossypium barbadense TaxID=3634 RepID=A0A2P5WT37_GOSBA|nr:hypothetical protein GOBAR_AA26424 [Gossypium barbadense]